MSLHRRAARRDANEAEIVAALRAVGATVQQLSGEDVPDLLVGFRGVDYLVEVKQAPSKGHSAKNLHAVLSEGQATWHAQWRGRPPVVVRTVGEALAAIGAVVSDRKTGVESTQPLVTVPEGVIG
jgi:Holliday junction resolvase